MRSSHAQSQRRSDRSGVDVYPVRWPGSPVSWVRPDLIGPAPQVSQGLIPEQGLDSSFGLGGQLVGGDLPDDPVAVPSPAEARGGKEQDQDRNDSFGECVFHGPSLPKKGSQVRRGPTPPTCTLAATARMNRRQGIPEVYSPAAQA